jgi:hypothetical protein
LLHKWRLLLKLERFCFPPNCKIFAFLIIIKNMYLGPETRSGFTEKKGSVFNEDGSGTVEEPFT